MFLPNLMKVLLSVYKFKFRTRKWKSPYRWTPPLGFHCAQFSMFSRNSMLLFNHNRRAGNISQYRKVSPRTPHLSCSWRATLRFRAYCCSWSLWSSSTSHHRAPCDPHSRSLRVVTHFTPFKCFILLVKNEINRDLVYSFMPNMPTTEVSNTQALRVTSTAPHS